MSYLNIRYPTGHLEVFLVKPRAPMIRLLESACAKRSLDPKAYKLMHRRRTVDLSLPFVYSGLTNRATLELVACDELPTPSPSKSTVRIGIRLEDGYRAECSGHPSSSVWSILESLASHDERIETFLSTTTDGLVPTVVYLQNQIDGEESLRETTLESLGIRGSALFQLHHRPPQPLQSVANGSLVLSPSAGTSLSTTGKEQPVERSSPPGQETPQPPALEHSYPPTPTAGTSQPSFERYSPQDKSGSVFPSLSSGSDTGFSENSPPTKRPPPPPTPQHSFPPTPVPGSSQPAYKQQLPQGESASIIFPSGSGGAPGVGTSPNLEPFSIFTSPSSRSMFDPDESAREHPKESMTVGEMIGISLEPDVPTASKQGAVPEHTPEFKFPTETEGQDLLHPKKVIGGGACGACAREEVLFQRQTTASHEMETEELPDEFFQLTERELRLIITDLRREATPIKRRLTSRGTDVLLGERSVQRSAASARSESCQRCVIRFTWPDDICLQACFSPQEHVSALYEFIQERLADTDLPFQLFTAPPRVVLSNLDETLLQAHLVPTARVHMTSPSASYKARDVLRADVLANMKSNVEAGNVASKWMPKSPGV